MMYETMVVNEVLINPYGGIGGKHCEQRRKKKIMFYVLIAVGTNNNEREPI